MKKITVSLIMAMFFVNVFAQQYVDLGLESGTLWKDQNEKGFYTYQEAERNFGNSMPTAPQLNELVNTCVWEWTDNGYKITGPNGKSIFLPAEGYYSCGADPKLKRVGTSGQYWSKTMTDYIMVNNPEDWDFPYCLTINSESKSVHYNNPECCKFTIRLVFEDEKAALKAKTQNQLAEGNEKAKSEAAEQRKQEEEQKKLENQKKLEEEAKRKAEEEDKSLEAQCISLKDIDGNKYKLVKIGTQCWMAENLRTTHYADGTEIFMDGNRVSNIIPYRYYPENSEKNLPTYGFYYNWAAVMGGSISSASVPSNIQGVCPNGWHVPSFEEYMTLLDYVASQPQYQCDGNIRKAVKAITSSTGWDAFWEVDFNNNNATGFNMLPAGGYVSPFFPESIIGFWAIFWTTTEKSHKKAYRFGFSADFRLDRTLSYNKIDAYPVRCLRGWGMLDVEKLAEQLKTAPQGVDVGNRNARIVEDLQAGFDFISETINATSTAYIHTLASSYPTTYNAGTNTGTSDYSSESSSTSGSSVSQYVTTGTATGVKITESGSVSSISCPIEKWNGSGAPAALIDGEHYVLGRNTTSSCNGVSVSQYSYVCHVTHGSRILYTVFVNF
ncbi:MAG: hypothetical protein J6X16_05660 [Bacteroidales bacterium]|nr:hypothetical protein [Bacteroidales bacterium]